MEDSHLLWQQDRKGVPGLHREAEDCCLYLREDLEGDLSETVEELCKGRVDGSTRAKTPSTPYLADELLGIQEQLQYHNL